MSDDEGGITQPQPTVQIMQSVAVTPMPEFCPDAKLGTSLATKWNNWQSDFDMYLTASGITDPTRKRALLLYQAGPRVREIFKQIPDTGTSADYDTSKDKLKAHFDPQKNKRYEVYRFRQATQESNETLDQFHTRLRTMAETCEFMDIEFEIEEQIIIGGRSSKIRKRALRDPTFDLKAMLIEGRRDEQSTFQTKEIESKETKDGETNRLAQQHGNNISNYKSTCKNCGREFPHKGACPARGKTCNNCGKPNHFATVCRAKQNPTEPITTTRMPKHPWTTLHVDFYGPLQTKEYLLVVIDRYSRFPEVDIVHSTKAAAVIPKLDRMFAVHGIPDVLISDNGPPFNSTDYKRYLETLGITPKFSTPLWPQGNAQAERFMRGLRKVLQTAKIQNRPWRQELSRFLLQYRTTPHSSTGVPPSELLFNRKIRGTLPVLSRNIIVNRHNEAREKESRRQEYNKSYVNNRRNTKKSNISVGDYVLVRQPKQNKLTPHFSQKPYLVIHKNKTVIKSRSTDGHEIERNISHFKKIPKSNDNESDDSDDLNDYHDHETEQNARNAQIVNDNNEDQDQVRRSTRTKRVPERYGQSLPSNLINELY